MAGFLTNSGLAKLAVATPIEPMTVKYMAFDSGQGTPTPNMTSLFDEAYRTEIPNPVKDPNAPKNLTFSGFVPTTVGGWTVYGVGLFDSLNVLIAYLELGEPVTKPSPDSALKMSWEQDFIITLANAGETDLIVTDSIQFRHDALTNRNHADSHPISAITGLDHDLQEKNIRMNGIDNKIGIVQQDINTKDAQNVKLTGDQTIDGYKTFNGNIGVETINNGNATISLENNGASIGAGSGNSFAGVAIDGSSKKVSVTGTLHGDGSGLDAATATKRGTVELATHQEVSAGTDNTRAVTPYGLSQAVIGMKQTWLDLTGQRASGVEYTSPSDIPIQIILSSHVGTSGDSLSLIVGGVSIAELTGSNAYYQSKTISAIIPPGTKYKANGSFSKWAELR